MYDGEWKNNKAHGVGLVTELDGNGGTLKWDGIFHEGLLLQRNEPRPPTPGTIHAETLHLVESVPVGIGYPERAMHSISSLVITHARTQTIADTGSYDLLVPTLTWRTTGTLAGRRQEIRGGTPCAQRFVAPGQSIPCGQSAL
ncbi:MAG: hypothetical protein ACPIOQ_17830 [Promethearchaeia archaeon]